MTNDLKFAGNNPVIINYNEAADEIFPAVRTSYADINIVSPKLLDDLYTAKKKDIVVKIKKNDEVIWEGYQTPNMFSQDVTLNLDEISMTTIDPISELKYFKIESIMSKPSIMNYKELIGKALAKVIISKNTLYVERNFTYGSSEYDGTNGLLDMKIQVSNFWDEGDEPETMLTMIEEMLKPFSLCLCFSGDAYYIYDISRTADDAVRTFDVYTISTTGALTFVETITKSNSVFTWTKNTSKSNISIRETYDKITGVASTLKPNYSSTVFDLINASKRDMYDIGYLNIRTNPIKGFTEKDGTRIPFTSDEWFYLWNGCYTDSRFNLGSINEYINGWLNINQAYKYLTGLTGHPNDYGTILNFTGGKYNRGATDKNQATERYVEVKQNITAYAPDNGTPPEFLEQADLEWQYGNPEVKPVYLNKLQKMDKTDAKWGVNRDGITSYIAYSQKYDNISLFEGIEQTLRIDLTQSYSRTGTATEIPYKSTSKGAEQVFDITGNTRLFSWGKVYYMPWGWNSTNIKYDYPWWNKYSTTGKLSPIWDKRRVDVFIKYTQDGVDYISQFNGKEWITSEGTAPSEANSFKLKRLMNNEKVYNTDFRYQIIECSDGTEYYLGDEKDKTAVVKFDKYGGVLPINAQKYDHTQSYATYLGGSNNWEGLIASVDEGILELNLPEINSINADITVNIYTSNLLGMTGSKSITSQKNHSNSFLVELSGECVTRNDSGGYVWGVLSKDNVGDDYKTIRKVTVDDCDFIPESAIYIKAEHLNLSISLSVPETNLGQVFKESDVKYILDGSNDYIEEYTGPTFRINTRHPLVAASFSYLIYGDELADPGLFFFKNDITTRPEAYTVQGYFNYLNTIRKIYETTIKPSEPGMNNIMGFIRSSEVGDKLLMITGDSLDVKTGRHSITAIECEDIEVTDINSVDVVEVPRQARNVRFRYPTV